MKQKDAVFAAINAAKEQGLEGDAAVAFAVEQVKTGLMSGEIAHSTGFTDPKKAESYAKALLSNWQKKDTRLTNGVKYVPEKRRGPIVKDETLKKLQASLKSLEVNQPDNADLIQRVKDAIEARKTEIAATKAQSKVASLDETLATLNELGIEVA